MKRLILSLTILTALSGATASAQKRSLSIDDCRSWQSLDNITMSDNARWLVYKYRRLYNDGPDSVYLYDAVKRTTRVLPHIANPQFLAEGKILKYDKANKDGTNTQFTLNLQTGKIKQWTKDEYMIAMGQSDYAYTGKMGGGTGVVVVNMLTDAKTPLPKATNVMLVGSGLLYIEQEGNNSVLCHFIDGKTERLGSVPHLVCNINPPTDGVKGTFGCTDLPQDRYTPTSLWQYDLKTKTCSELFQFADIKGLPEGTKVGYSSRFINGNRQYLINLEPTQYDNNRPQGNPKVTLELWKWDEDVSPRRQFRNRGGFDASQYDTYIYDLQSKKLLTIPTQGLHNVSFFSGDHVYGAIAVDPTAWYKESDWKMTPNTDLYYIGLNGQRKLLAQHGLFDISWSPDGKRLAVYIPEKKSWNVVDMLSGTITDVSTGKVPFPLFDEDSDYPFLPGAYGIASWSADGKTLTVYDRYDLWQLGVDGKRAAVCLTSGWGRKHQVRLHLAEHAPMLKNGQYLSGMDMASRSTGLYSLVDSRVKQVAMVKGSNLSICNVSASGKTMLWCKENFGERDYWLADVNFSNPQRVTDMNPQQRHIKWGTSKLYSWTNYEGKRNEGNLFLPEGYRKGISYPMVVTFYERETQNLNNYRMPEYSSAIIDIPWFVSNGYIVFQPDIHATVGKPGESCYNAVVSGVRSLIADGIADSTRIGVNGHSWGGFETAYLVTRTNLFKCASPCSAVTDMVADYLMMRGTGQPNMYFEEDAQGRLGKTLWEAPQMYIDNSAVYHADKIHTPLLIFHGSEDRSVQPYQGMALFLALRRLQRPAWLLYYKNEGHQMGGEDNCRDFTEKLTGFFGYYLKNEPQPNWMK